MAEFFCDVSAVGNEYQAYADTPASWGVPQDGNGKAGPGHAAAVAIATIDVAGCSASGTGTIGVLGVTVSSTLNASGSALATAIANAINAATTAVSATYSANLLPLNRLVYARVNPGLNTQVQIMLRIAGTDWNGMSPTQANISPAATIGAFAGGADGPFGYLASSSTLFGRTIGLWGAYFAASGGVTEPGITDVVHVRTRRSGANLSNTMMQASGSSLTLTWRGRNWLYDNGTVWSGDNGSLVASLGSSTGTLINVDMQPSTSGSRHVCRAFGGVEFRLAATGNNLGNVRLGQPVNNASIAFIDCLITEGAGNIGRPALGSYGSSIACNYDLTGSLIRLNGVARTLFDSQNSGPSGHIVLNGLRIEIVAATGAIGTFFQIISNPGLFRIDWVGGGIYDTNGVYRCVNPFTIANTISTIEITLDGVAGITDPSIGFSGTTGNGKLLWSMTEGPDRAFRHETIGVVVDWKGDGTFPHCGAANLQGDLWSHRITWNTLPSASRSMAALRLGYFYRAAAASKTITLELYVPNATTMYEDELEMQVDYMDSSNVWRNERVGGLRALQAAPSGRTALASSAKSWTANGVAAHSAKKLTLTTAQPIKQNSELIIRLSLATSRSPAVTFFASPEVGVS